MEFISLDIDYRAPELERRNLLENPSVPLSSPAAWAYLASADPTAAGEAVNEMIALQTLTVYACVRVIAESVASLPAMLWERLTRGRAKAVDEDLFYLLTVQPNPEMSAFTFFETLSGCLALTGNCYAQIVRDGAGRIAALYPLHPLKTEPIRLPDNSIGYKTSDGESEGRYRILRGADVLHLPLFCFDGLKGLSPIGMARQSIGLTRAAEKFGARFFGNGSRPGGILTPTDPAVKKTEVQLQQVKDSWKAAQGGANQGSTAVLPGGWTYTQVGLSPEDSQFLATRKFQREDIAGLFRVPPHKIGDTSRLSNGNHEQESLGFVTDTLRPYVCRFEQELSRKLLPKTGRTAGKFFIEFDLRERLRGDFQTTMAGLALGRQWGFISINMALEEIGQNPIGPEGDVFLYPLNMGNAQDLLDAPDERLAAGGAGMQKGEGSTPSADDKRAIVRYTHSYLALFRDAIGRLSTRNKRDFETISTIFKPSFETLCAVIEDTARSKFQLPADWKADSEKLIRERLKSIEKRAAGFTPETVDENTREELSKALRSLTLNIFREAGASLAPEIAENS